MIYADNTKGIISLTLTQDDKLHDLIDKLLADGYWVHELKSKGDKVIIEIKGA